MGYGTARIARQLPPGGRVVSIEAGEEQVGACQLRLQRLTDASELTFNCAFQAPGTL